MLKKRTSITQFIVVSTLLNTLLYHFPLYSFSWARLDMTGLNGWLTLATITVLSLMMTSVILIFLLLVSRRLAKGLSIVFVLLNSLALYFMSTFQVTLDLTMIGNIFNTQSSEALSYWHPSLLLYFVFLGILPSWLIAKTSLQAVKRWVLIVQALLVVLLSVAWISLNSSTWLWIDKYSKYVGGQIMPWSYVINSARYFADKIEPQEQQPLPNATFNNKDKKVVVLIIGETARQMNFSFYGYQRNTTPLLSKEPIIALNDPSSCATYTTESVACILSHSNRAEPSFEPLPSYLSRQGVDVIWRTRNWGEPPIKVNAYQKRGELKQDCQGEKCGFDELLLTGLSQRINESTADKILIIMHTKGSHGPSYFTQYPKRFEQFKPVCRSVDLSQCSYEELQNAYDNSILYTDYFISQTIQLLKQQNMASSLLYLSDHGESLGESGYYLHGTPMMIAPKEQTKIPFFVWMSPDFAQQKGIDLTSFQQAETHSQANVFHSVMGALDMSSDVYKPALDVFQR